VGPSKTPTLTWALPMSKAASMIYGWRLAQGKSTADGTIPRA
jgi:hypothetical protein